MEIILYIALGLFALFAIMITYSCCIVASKTDRMIEEYFDLETNKYKDLNSCLNTIIDKDDEDDNNKQ